MIQLLGQEFPQNKIYKNTFAYKIDFRALKLIKVVGFQIQKQITNMGYHKHALNHLY